MKVYARELMSLKRLTIVNVFSTDYTVYGLTIDLSSLIFLFHDNLSLR